MNEDLFLLFIVPLNRAKIAYMVTGSAAVTVYGEPRLTNDVDIVLSISQGDVDLLSTLYSNEMFYFPPVDVVHQELVRSNGGGFNVIHHETGFKGDFYVAQDALHRWGMERRSCVDISGEQVWLAPPEYVILRKLQFHEEGGSEKHLRDIQGILRISAGLLATGALMQWVHELGLTETWKKVAR